MEILTIISIIVGTIAGVVGIVAPAIQEVRYHNQKKKANELKPNPDPLLLSESSHEFSNLPGIEDFWGRDLDLERLECEISKKPKSIAIIGIGGLGKSALAKKIAHNCLSRKKFQAYVWITAKDTAPKIEDILDTILRTFNSAPSLKLELPQKLTFVSQLLSANYTLLVLDSYESFSSDRQVLSFVDSIPQKSMLLITTREIRNIDAVPIYLEGLSKSDAIAFIENHSNRIGFNPNEVLGEQEIDRLLRITGSTPLALKWTLAQLNLKRKTVEMVFRMLEEGKADVFLNLFSSTWQAIDENSRNVLTLISYLVEPITIGTIIGCLQLPVNTIRECLDRLINLFLLESDSQTAEDSRRYEMHPLTRSFARAKLHEFQGHETNLFLRTSNFYIAYATEHGGNQWEWSHFDDLEKELGNLMFIVRKAVETHSWQLIGEFRNQLTLFLSIRGHWRYRLELAENAIIAADAIGDDSLKGWCLVYDVAYIAIKYNELQKAKEKIEEGLQIFKHLQDKLGIATCHRHLGRIYHEMSNFSEAERLYKRSLGEYEAIDKEYAAFLLWDLGELYWQKGDVAKAKSMFSKSARDSEGKIGKSQAINGMAHGYLGEIELRERNFIEAEEHFKRELKIAYEIGRSDEIALANRRLAILSAQKGEPQEITLAYARKAHEVYLQLADTQNTAKILEIISQISQS